MMSVACSNLGFVRTRLEFVACGFSNASLNRISVRNCWIRVLGNVNRPDFGCSMVFSTKNLEAFPDGVAAGAHLLLDSRKHTKGSSNSLSCIFEVVEEDILTLNKNLNSIFDREDSVFMSAAAEIFESGGKRMRPALVFLVSKATAAIAGLEAPTEEHKRLAEIIEMVHTASLIHDDVIDESDMRRGKETFHQVYGTKVAVLAGDFMFALSSVYMANLENHQITRLLTQAIQDLVRGEIKQASNLFDCDVHLDEYIVKNYYKTASFIAASTEAAAIISGVNNDIIERMHQYGKNLGLSFQVVDDILDFTRSTEHLGKPSKSDLAQGNLTAPVIFALEKEPKLRDIIDSKFSEMGSIEKAIDIVKNSGGIDRARELARKFADIAVENLSCLPPSSFRLALEQIVSHNLELIK